MFVLIDTVCDLSGKWYSLVKIISNFSLEILSEGFAFEQVGRHECTNNPEKQHFVHDE
jgi:hypothetical protein